jgi:hypothetical protein
MWRRYLDAGGGGAILTVLIVLEDGLWPRAVPGSIFNGLETSQL